MAYLRGGRRLRIVFEVAGSWFPVGTWSNAAFGAGGFDNDWDLAADLAETWAHLEQVYQVKVKGSLTLLALERLGKRIGVKMQTECDSPTRRGASGELLLEGGCGIRKRKSCGVICFKENNPLESNEVGSGWGSADRE